MEKNDTFHEYIEWFREELLLEGRNLQEVNALVDEEIEWIEVKAHMVRKENKEGE